MHFDVPGWLASVVGCARDELTFEAEQEVEGVLTVKYSRGGTHLASVDVAALPMNDARRGSWQLLAKLGDRIERVQLPANTRFAWR